MGPWFAHSFLASSRKARVDRTSAAIWGFKTPSPDSAVEAMGLRKEPFRIATPVAVVLTGATLAGATVLGAWCRLAPEVFPASLRGFPESAVGSVASACAAWLLANWRRSRQLRHDW